jgi:hypothetical protein
LIVIVLVIVATAVLFAWLAIELGRMAFGEIRLPRPFAGVRAGPAGVPGGPGPWVGDDAEVELVVRERLYGSHDG